MKPNTCHQCGCYIPDGWDMCPACEGRVSESQGGVEEIRPIIWMHSGGVANNWVCGGGSGTFYTSATGKKILFKWENTDE